MTETAITVKQALERGRVTRRYCSMYRKAFYTADLCGERRFDTGKAALLAFADKCKELNQPAE